MGLPSGEGGCRVSDWGDRANGNAPYPNPYWEGARRAEAIGSIPSPEGEPIFAYTDIRGNPSPNKGSVGGRLLLYQSLRRFAPPPFATFGEREAICPLTLHLTAPWCAEI